MINRQFGAKETLSREQQSGLNPDDLLDARFIFQLMQNPPDEAGLTLSAFEILSSIGNFEWRGGGLILPRK
jgi:hypothetical protein